MMAIPKSLLIHEVVRLNIKGKDRWGKEESVPTGTRIRRVRIEPSSRIVRDKNNAEVKLAAIMFYDCRNSEPRNIVFVEDDIIEFQGAKYKVQIVEPLYGERKLHHYELGLIKHA